MFKVSRMLTRSAGIDSQEFVVRWHEWFGPVIARLDAFEPAMAHVQNLPVGSDSPIANAPASPFDGVEEYWFESLADARAFEWGALPTFVDPAASRVIAGAPEVMWHRPAAPRHDAVKMIIMPVRREGSTEAEFRHHWINVHAKLALDGPGTRGRLQHVEFTPSDRIAVSGLKPAPFEGTGTISFDSAQDLKAEFSGDYYRTTLAPDELRFSNPRQSRAMMVRVPNAWSRGA